MTISNTLTLLTNFEKNISTQFESSLLFQNLQFNC
jgi:hypothetical protein